MTIRNISNHWKAILAAGLLAVMGGTYALSQGAGGALVTTLSSGDVIPVTPSTNPTLNVGITATNLATYIKASGSGPSTITSASANALAVGPTGTTAPTFNVDASVTSNVTGLNVQGQATTAGVFVTALGSTNEPVFLAGKGTGPVYIGGTTTTLAGLQVAQTASRVNGIIVTPAATGTAAVIQEGGAGADANRDLNVAAAGTGIITLGQARATCSGTTTATCQGQRFTASITGLTTAAAGTTSAAMTVTNASVVSSASIVECKVNGYAGTGIPLVTTIIPGTGQVSFTITNVAASGALNATVPAACVVF